MKEQKQKKQQLEVKKQVTRAFCKLTFVDTITGLWIGAIKIVSVTKLGLRGC